jgi:hypothetical protein
LGDDAYKEVTLVTFALTVGASGAITTTKAAGQGPQSFSPAIALVVRADDANDATIYWGMGGVASDPLAATETAAVDLPAGYFMDLSKLCVSGEADDILHVVGAVIELIP